MDTIAVLRCRDRSETGENAAVTTGISLFFDVIWGFLGCFFNFVDFNHRVPLNGRTLMFHYSLDPQGGLLNYGESPRDCSEKSEGPQQE